MMTYFSLIRERHDGGRGGSTKHGPKICVLVMTMVVSLVLKYPNMKVAKLACLGGADLLQLHLLALGVYIS